VHGQWGLIPTFAKEPRLPYSTNNVRISAHRGRYFRLIVDAVSA
jgi:putative SOS response-associated peptidase YedK